MYSLSVIIIPVNVPLPEQNTAQKIFRLELVATMKLAKPWADVLLAKLTKGDAIPMSKCRKIAL